MSLAPPLWKCQNGAKCFQRCPGCPGPLRKRRYLSDKLNVVDENDFSEPPDGGIPNFLKRKPVERYRRGS